jgi:hypothetical protein
MSSALPPLAAMISCAALIVAGAFCLPSRRSEALGERRHAF